MQNLLRTKRNLEGKLAKLGSSLLEDSENSSHFELGKRLCYLILLDLFHRGRTDTVKIFLIYVATLY